MRQLVMASVAFVGAVTLAACGGSAAPTAAPTAAPSPTPSATVAPTATLAASEAPATAGDRGSAVFIVAGLTSTLSVGADSVDPSTFATSFPSETPAIIVPFQLAPGLSGKVTSTWKSVGGEANVTSFDYPASAPWAYFRLTYADGFIPGDYEEILSFDQTGDSVTLAFTITGPRRAPATPTPLPSGTSAFTLLRAATAADTSQPLYDAATFTDSFPTTAPAIFVVFALQDGLTGKVTCTMTVDGSPLIQPLSLDYGTGNSWGDFQVTPAGSFPAGDYVATVTFTPTGEAATVEFTVK